MLNRILEPKIDLDENRKIFKNKDLKVLILPLIIEQLLLLIVGIIDTLMVSYAGEAAVSGVSLVNQINSIFISLFTAVGAGGAVIISQYIGRQEKENGCKASSQLILISLCLSVFLTTLILVFRKNILFFLFGNVEAEVMTACMTYLLITALSFPALALYNSCSAILRSISRTKTTMMISICMNCINLIGNYIGVFILHAGVAGVAIPSLISRSVAAIMMLIICSNKNNAVYLCLSFIFSYHKDMIKRIVHIAVPNGIEGGMLDLSKVALSSIVAMFGTTQIAANGVAQSFWSMAALFSVSMGPVFITVIGRCVGANDYDAASYYMKKLLYITYIGCIIWDTIFFVLTPFILKFYSLSNETIHLVIILCLIHNFFNAILHPSGFALANGLRAAGDVKYTMYVSIFATVIVRVFFSVVLGVWLNLEVIGVALAMAIDWLVRAILIQKRYHKGKWKEFQVI